MILEPPKFLEARKPYSKNVPMIISNKDHMAWSDADSATGLRPLIELLTDCRSPRHVNRHPSSLLVCVNPLRTLMHLHRHFQNSVEWNFKLSIHDKDSFVNGAVRTQKEDASVSFVGFRDPKNRHTWYHYIICPSRFTRSNLNQLIPGNQPEIVKLQEWAQSLYQFAQENGMKVSGSAGGLAAQFLRDKRFYPHARRKIPMATNERARKALPGNHYEMRGELKRIYSAAIYFDQENAHHWAASNVELPDADWLYARGHFHNDKIWCVPGNYDYENTVRNEYGLLYLRLWVPRYLDGYLPEWAMKAGSHDAYIFTNEVPFLESLGVEIRGLYAAWTSPLKDNGLNRYSKWAIEQIKQHPHDKEWLKSLLLATYGVLASKPRRYEFGYYRAKGERKSFLVGPQELFIVRTNTKRENQLPVANVIHRGMIEAETRKLSVGLARQLESENHTVLSIYADGVIMKDDGEQLPLLLQPWRAKHRLQYLAFTDPTSFESDLLKRQPGRKRELKDLVKIA